MEKNQPKSAAGGGNVRTETALRVGIDLGTNTSVIAAADDGKPVPIENDIVTTVVGVPKAGIIPGILPDNTDMLFGSEALDYRLHLDLKWPLCEGFVEDVEVCRHFTSHLRTLLSPTRPLWGVVGAPANASPERQKEIRATMIGVLERLLIVPEPFLAAMGLREDEGFRQVAGESDPTRHSLIVDIGAGTTDLCVVCGCFPTAKDQYSFSFAGNYIDALLWTGIQRRFPDLQLSPVTITELKEKYAFVSGFDREATAKVYVDGRPHTIDFSEILQEACNSLVPRILKGIKELLARTDSDSIVHVMKNIIVTGGGSQIHGLCETLQKRLREDGFDCARTVRPKDHKRLVARGALKIANNVRDDQWQVPM